MRQRLIVATGADFEAVADGAGRRVIAYVGTVPLAERARLTAQRDALRDQHRAGAIDDRRYFARSSGLHRRIGSAVVVVEDEDGRWSRARPRPPARRSGTSAVAAGLG